MKSHWQVSAQSSYLALDMDAIAVYAD